MKNPEKLAKELLDLCINTGLRGRILIASEGVNGSVSGTKEQIDKYMKEMKKDPRFSDVVFKEDAGDDHPFKKMSTHVKKEIVRFEKPVDMSKTGKYLSPKEFLDLYNKKDFIILDTRNDYEWKVGKFKNAKTFNIKTFREFPKVVEKLDKLKEKNIAMYCTGGIRCEKASAYMVERGFKNVYQLEGGILNFCKEYPDTVWEGKCFVFDKRLVSKVNKKDNTIAKCCICKTSYDQYRNCKNPICDKLIIVCKECQLKFKKCCSKKCMQAYEKLCRQGARKNQGKRNK